MATNFEQHLLRVLRGYAGEITKRAKAYAPNLHLRHSISSYLEILGGRKFIIRIEAYGADAKAREYGSGLHARRGEKKKYLILPKNYPALIFPWDVPTSKFSGAEVHPNVPRTKEGNVILQKVEHPGVEAANSGKGYIHPAINDVKRQMRQNLSEEMKSAIILDIRASIRKKE